MPSVDLYGLAGSAPCRAVMLTARAYGVTCNLKNTDLRADEHKTPQFLKMNPQHTIPTLDDNGFYMNESRAMMQYLANKYGKDNDKLYPKDPEARAKVDMRLYFDMGTLYHRYGDAYYPVIFGKAPVDPEKKEKLDEALGFLEEYIRREGGYAAGNHMTIADFSLAASLSTIDATGHDFSKFAELTKYYKKLQGEVADYQELNQKGIDEFVAWIKEFKGK